MKTAVKNSATQETSSPRKSFFKRPAEQSFFQNVQTKLTVGKPGDKYEVEADAMADKVVQRLQQPNSDAQTPFFQSFQGNTALQQKCDTCEEDIQTKINDNDQEVVQAKAFTDDTSHIGESNAEVNMVNTSPVIPFISNTLPTISKSELGTEEEVQAKEEESSEETVQLKISEFEEEVQTKPSLNVQMKEGSSAGSSSLESQLSSSKGSGSSLPQPTKNQMESSFGADFGGVKVHTDSNAVAMSQSLNAQAFTHGSDVYFNEGKYDTSSSGGQHLLAHELTHTVQQGAAVQKKEQISTTATGIQRLFDFDLSSLNEYARYIPGWTLFTVLMGYNPLLGQAVERNAINVLDGLMGLVPLGTLIFNKLQEHNIITDAYNWTMDLIGELNLTSAGIVQTFEEAWETMDFVRLDPFDYNVGVLTRKFSSLYNRVREFAFRVGDKVFTMIKEVLKNTIKRLAAAIPGYSLLTKIMRYDPLTDSPVEASTADIIEDFLMMVGAEQELEKMKETGQLEETATWIDQQLAILDFSLEDITIAFVTAWDAFSARDLIEPMAALERTVGIFAPFALKVYTFGSNVVSKVFELIKKYLLGLLKNAANTVPGYHLLTVILEKDPFTEEHVPRTAENLIRGFMGLIPGGEAQFQEMKESGAIGRLTDWLDAEVEALGLTWPFIKNMFLEIWNSFTIENLMNPEPAFVEVITRFGEPLSRLIRFVKRLVMKVIEIILELMNFPIDLIRNIIANAQSAFADIKKDPIGFLKNILRAIKEGFSLFFSNIGAHLLNGVTGWLFGQLGEAGITPPADFSFESILGLVFQILNVTTDRIMEKVAARIGPERMARLQGMADTAMGVWSFVSDVMERGPIAIWEKIQEKLTTLWDTVLGSIKQWIMTTIIGQVTTKLLSMLDPTGIMAVINGCIAFYNAVQSFIEYLREMLEIVNSFVAGVAEIARGSVNSAAQFLEGALSQTMPVAIGFLANQVGLGSIGRRVGEMIADVRVMVDEALDWLVDKAVTMGESALGALGIGGGQQNADSPDGLDDSEVGKSVRFNVEGESHRIWIQVNGNDVEVMLASTPTPIPQKIAFFKDRKDSLPEEKKEQATGLIGQAEANYLITKEKAQQAKTEISEAQNNPTNEEIQQAQQKDQETENAEETLKANILDLFRLFGDENGITTTCKEELSMLHSSAHDGIMDEILSNNSEYATIQNWSALKTKLLTKDPAKRPIRKQHTYGAYVYNNQAVQSLNNAISDMDNFTDNKLKPATSRPQFIDNRIGTIHGGQGGASKVRDALQDELFDGNRESLANTALYDYFKHSLENQGEHSDYYPNITEYKIENNQFFLKYDYSSDAETEGGKQDFMVRLNLRNAEERVVDQSTTGRNLVLKESGTRGRTASAGVLAEAGFSNLNSAHILADWFTGSGYKGALNLIATSAHYNQEIMGAAEASLANQIAAFTDNNSSTAKITSYIQVDTTWQAFSKDKVIDTLKAIQNAKDNMSPAEIEDLAKKTYEKLQARQFPRKCLRVRYQARIAVGNPLNLEEPPRPTSLRFTEQIGADIWLTF